MSEKEIIRRLKPRPFWPASDLPDGVSVSDLTRLDCQDGPFEFAGTRAGPWGRLTESMMRSLAFGGFYVRVSDAGRLLLAKLPPPRADQQTEPERALMLYRWAVEAKGDAKLTDRAAYDYIHATAKEPLPKYETWDRYLRRAREDKGEQKDPQKRAHFGRSVVRPQDL